MLQVFKIFFLIVSLLPATPNDNRQKRALLIEALETIYQEKDLKVLIPIVKRSPDFSHKIPLGSPLVENFRISSSYGRRTHPITQKMEFHSGTDLAADFASKIIATADGTVTFAGWQKGYGKTVIIQHEYGFYSVYGHMTLFYTKKGKKVKKGDVIGFVGSTGKSTGDHLHYEIRKNNKTLNPSIFLE